MKRQPKMLLFLTTCLVVIFACKPTPRRVNHATHITPGMAHNLILQQQNNSSFKLIDVRTHDEFNVDHITGAINIDWNSQKDILLKLNKNDTLLLYCRSGRRSKLAISLNNKKCLKCFNCDIQKSGHFFDIKCSDINIP